MEIFSVMASMSLIDMITAPLRSIGAQMNVTNKAAASLSSGALALAKSLLPIALAAGILLAALAPCVSTAADFEAAMANVGAVSRATPVEMRELSGAARELGATTAWSAMQVAEGQKYLAMAGFSVRENIAALPAVLNMASAGTTELGRAADISSDILSAFNMEAAQMPRVADTLTAAFTTSNTSLELLGETMKYVAPVAEKAGVSLEGTAAMAGLLGNVGIKGSQAGTALRAMLNGLAAPSSEAAKSIAALGITTTDAMGNLRNPITILGDMAKATESMGSAQKMAFTKTVFGTEAMSAVLALFDQAGAGGITEYAKQLSAAGTAAEVAARQNDNLAGDQKALGSAFESLQITIGSLFLPAMRGLAHATTWVVRGLDVLAGSPVGKFLLTTAAVLGVTVIAVTLMSGAVWAGTAAWAAFNLVILANPIGIIVLAIVGLVTALIALYNHCDTARELMDNFATGVSMAWKNIKGIASAIGDFFSILSGVGVMGVFAYYFTDIYNAAGDLWDRLTSLFDFDLTESGRKLFMTLANGIKSVITAPYDLVKAGLSKVRQLLPFSDAHEGPLSALTLSGTRIMDTLGSGIRAAAPNLHATASTALAGVAVAANLAVAPPAPSSPPTLAPIPAHATAPDRATTRQAGNTITIQHLTVQLPDVQDADGFMTALQELVAQHDGSGEPEGDA
ncbi:phage tail tape measure protein [Pseudodesulfovibrio sp. JC047]|uniref:phage tail tape measure protein n=1 Tax=Pseudodesulfovibrio sp. JC047 TaxID=2683199 RepID=UPI0013D2EC20|nr:phage tail tape measure protein [Pseudodesulfovibrio sp. JC047]NDV18273.1 phage tail tape measure protein [Pseudodesulfovibrio sp. JC047]